MPDQRSERERFLYTAVPDVEGTEKGSDSTTLEPPVIVISRPRNTILFVSLVLNLFLFGGLASIWGRYTSLLPQEAVAPIYTPVLDVIPLEQKVFTGLSGRTKYHGPPTPEVDEAWEALYQLGVSAIPKSQAALLANRTERLPGDEENYVVELDVFHQLHCLNQLRKSLWPEYYPDIDRFQQSAGGPELEIIPFDHLDHCLNTIREYIMCNVDLTPNVWHWMENRGRSFVRFDVPHTCRSFDAVHEWAERTKLRTRFNESIHIEDDLVYPGEEK